ncbi:hypothetical protein ACJ72_05642 [Emergomyces africanus]|uniref:Uncharacterized protein n=1 Tax=Emergomyces africanus TaxID=1955775 RepID=A0A1B7NTV1_9EURO|nr:hypothetical protein ACJ72_05642 [Emergomyces africanus]
MPIQPTTPASTSTGAGASKSEPSTSQQLPSQPQQAPQAQQEAQQETQQKAQPGTTTPAVARSSNTTSMAGQSGDGQLSKEEAERLYEERMEEEYAKREGGA